MKRTLLVTSVLVAVVLVAARAQQPTFRSSVDFVELDVFVPDARGEFVKDLSPSTKHQMPFHATRLRASRTE